jgi:Protein of unknown function (DUF3592)
MQIVTIMTGVWVALGGLIASLAGTVSMRKVRRLRRTGATAWAMIVRSEDRRTAVQFTLPDGLVVERFCPERGKRKALTPGEKILVWYDPADPADVLVSGRQGKVADGMFVAGGSLLIVIGAAFAALVR